MITTGATVVTSPGSLPQCMGALTVTLYKIREFGSRAVFLHLVMRDWRKKNKKKGLSVTTPRSGATRSSWLKALLIKSLHIGLEHFPVHSSELN